MTTVKITTTSGHVPLINQTPGSTGIWGDFRFYVDEPVEHADWWVVIEALPTKESLMCPRENTILIANENEYMKEYDAKFLKQFYRVITCHQTMRHPRKILMQQGHFSHLFWSRPEANQSIEDFQKQFKSYDYLKALTPQDIPKTKLLSVVVSHKANTEGQRLRHEFIREMKKHFGDRLDVFCNKPEVFGPETKVEKIKWNSIAPYKYYLAIENSVVPQYWTTNMPDAHVAGAYPFYYGHPTISEYYKPSMFTPIDIKDVPGSIATIEKAIAENSYEKHIADIWEARNLWLDKYALFPTLANLLKTLPSGNNASRITMAPEKKIFLKNRVYGLVEKYPPLLKLSRTLYKTYEKIRHAKK